MMPARLLGWVRARDGGLFALRRATRAAIVMPGLFALSVEVIGNPTIGAFAAFGSFAMLLLASFGGPLADRLRSQVALALAGAVLIVLGTAVSTVDWLAAIVTALVAFAVLFAGVVSSVLASATVALLISFILPTSLPGSISTVPDRLAGWGMAAGAALLAVTFLWPVPSREPLRAPAIAACRALAARLRAHIAYLLGEGGVTRAILHEAVAHADEAVSALDRAFYGTPYRPTGLTTSMRYLVRLVDEIDWLNAIVLRSTGQQPRSHVDPAVCAVKSAAAEVLERGAALLEATAGDAAPLEAAQTRLREAIAAMERSATIELPATPAGDGASGLITALDPSFRAQELSFVIGQIGSNIEAVGAAERRSWIARLLGRPPEGLPGTLAAAQERAASHVEPHSVWLHNSLRGGAALGVAVLIAALTDAQHSFWVVLGALSVLRSNALSTGQNAVRGLAGTVAGFIAGGVLLLAIGSNITVLWLLLAPAVLVAGFAPAAVSFAAGQGAFTLTLVILYNILQPAGWKVGLVRVEDVALGCAISLLVGVLFWPRGAGAALGRSLAAAYRESAQYLSAAVAFGIGRCDASAPDRPAPAQEAARAAAAARRLDDTFRNYLAERGAKRIPLAEATSLVTGVAGLRLAGDAVLDLWQRDAGGSDGDREAARQALVAEADLVTGWYETLASSLAGSGSVPDPLPREGTVDGPLLDALGGDLTCSDRRASATAVRMIWTGDHLDAARRLQGTLVAPARAAVEQGRADGPPGWMSGWRARGRPAADAVAS
jgi:uncharacterized membrane protein YccC